jgi:hypothetical protein
VQFHLGPDGDLRALPIIERTEQVDATRAETAGISRSLTGQVTKDVLGRARGRWELRWMYLTGEQTALLSALRAGRLGRTLRLLDPDRPNLMHVRLATGGSEERSTDGWYTSAGTLTWQQVTGLPADLLTDGAISWERTTTAESVLAPGRLGPAYRAPVLDGQAVRFSLWLRATSGTPSASIGVDHYDTAGTRVTETAAAAITVPTTWTEWSYTWTPGAGRVSAAPLLHIAAAQAASTVQVTGAQAVYGTAAQPWREGGGAPLVVVENLAEIRPSLAEHNVMMALLETS